MFGLVGILNVVIGFLWLAILASAIISWLRYIGVRVPHYHPVVQVVEQTAGLLLNPIRRAIPTTAGGLDFSPIVAMVLLEIVRRLINQML